MSIVVVCRTRYSVSTGRFLDHWLCAYFIGIQVLSEQSDAHSRDPVVLIEC